MLFNYRCGHIGKMAGRKVKRFIGVAEIRHESIEFVEIQCPNCEKEEITS